MIQVELTQVAAPHLNVGLLSIVVAEPESCNGLIVSLHAELRFSVRVRDMDVAEPEHEKEGDALGRSGRWNPCVASVTIAEEKV